MTCAAPEPPDIRCPINFGPRQVPTIRDQMINHWSPGGVSRRIEQVLRDSGNLKEWTPIPDKAKYMQANLKLADLYWVSSEMCDLLDSSRDSVPTDSTLTEDLIPGQVRRGLVFFQRTLKGYESRGPQAGQRVVHVDAVHWFPVVRTDKDDVPCAELRIHSYAHTSHPLVKMHTTGGSEWGLGCPMTEWADHKPVMLSVLEDRQLLMAFFGLLASPGVIEERRLQPSKNRSARRREGDVAAVRLIYLRGSDHHARAGSGHEYHHRWIVSGHWRSQAHGPGRTLRRPIWIRPHVKGPEGAPLLTGEKVKVLA